MKNKITLKILTTILYVVSIHATSRTFAIHNYEEKTQNKSLGKVLTSFTYDFDPKIVIQQNVNDPSSQDFGNTRLNLRKFDFSKV